MDGHVPHFKLVDFIDNDWARSLDDKKNISRLIFKFRSR